MRETEKIWMNGELVAWDDARIHVGTHGLHYGSGVFEGIRAYETPNGTAVFRLTDHLKRLENSAKLLGMSLPFSVDDLRAASHELIAVNRLPECYLRPIAFFGYGELGVSAIGNPVDVVIMSWPWGAYLGEEGLTKGIRAKISSWQRIGRLGHVRDHVRTDPLPARNLGADALRQALFAEVGAPGPAHDHNVDRISDRRDTELAVAEEGDRAEIALRQAVDGNQLMRSRAQVVDREGQRHPEQLRRVLESLQVVGQPEDGGAVRRLVGPDSLEHARAVVE